jgi:hypothetical protein
MSDDNDSGGMIGGIISILILAVIWPYLLGLLGLYIAYMAVIAVLEWLAQNPLIVVFTLFGIGLIYAVFRYRLIPKYWRWVMAQLEPQAALVDLSQYTMTQENVDVKQRKFIPSTNLYCYWCTCKLGIQAWEKNGHYYCDKCNAKQSNGAK